MDHNPYATPRSEVEGVSANAPAGAEADRRAHLSVEQGLKSIGSLYVLTGGLACLGLVLTVVMGVIAALDSTENLGVFALSILVWGFIGPPSVWIGLSLRRRNPAVRIVASILAGLSLLSFPMGTLVGGYTLWLMWSAKGKRVFAPDYQSIVDATPHIVYKSSRLAWGAALLLLLVSVSLVALVLIA